MSVQVRILTHLRDVTRDAWDACFPKELENYDYLRVTEDAQLHGFHWRYIAAYEDDTLIAAIPAFFTDYPIDTTLEGTGKKIAVALRARMPNLLTLKLACIGSPVTELAQIGFHPDFADARKLNIFETMLDTFETHAYTSGYRLLGVKDIAVGPWSKPLAGDGYQCMPGLPVATLPIDFPDMESYFASLSAATRKDMRRKLKSRDGLRIEQRSDITNILPQMLSLYRATSARAEMQLEELNAAFFSNVASQMPGRALYTLYWVGEELLAFNMLLKNETTLLDKFFCMDERGREYNLYFVSWFTNIEYCLANKLTIYQSGAAGYENKLRLGSKLTATNMAFKHKNRLIQGALRMVAKFHVAETQTLFKEAA